MQNPEDYTLAEALQILTCIRDELYCVYDEDSDQYELDPDKEWSSETLENVALLIQKMIPEEVIRLDSVSG